MVFRDLTETGLLRSVQPAVRIRVYGACCSRCCFLVAEGASLFTDLLGFRGRRVGFHFWSLTQVRVIGQKRKLSFRNFLAEKKKNVCVQTAAPPQLPDFSKEEFC